MKSKAKRRFIKKVFEKFFMFVKRDKKAMSQVIVLALLILSFTLASVYLLNWFNIKKSDVEIIFETGNFERRVEIDKVDGTFLYVENDFRDGLQLLQIVINDSDCNVASSLINRGYVAIDIGTCTLGLEESTAYEVKLITNMGVKSEYEILRSVAQLFTIRFQTAACDFSSGYVRLYGLSSLDNAHAEIPSSSLYTYSACAKHAQYQIGTASSGNFTNLFYLTETNNSMIWIDKGSIYQSPAEWFNISISYSGGNFSYVINTTAPDSDYVCAGSIERDDVYGSHIGDCRSSMPDKLWVKLV